MKSICRFPVAAVVLFFSISPAGYCGEKITERVINEEGGRKLIIVMKETGDFKNSVLEKVINNYSGTCRIEVKNRKYLRNLNDAGYDAVLIIETLKAWTFFNKKALKAARGNDRVVLFFTSGDPDFTYNKKGVDAVSAASDRADPGKTAEEIISRLDGILK